LRDVLEGAALKGQVLATLTFTIAVLGCLAQVIIVFIPAKKIEGEAATRLLDRR
jgi:hypothetical protein